MTQRLIQVGTGGQGEAWVRRFLPPNAADGTVEVVAAVDMDEDALDNATDALDLREEDCYTDAAEAFESVEADAAALVVPPHVREDLVDLCIDHDLDVISEKPLADTMEGAIRTVRKVEQSNTKMGVTMTHRFREDITTLRRHIGTEENGPADNIYGRYAVNARSYGSWAGPRLYEWEEDTYPLLVDGSVHHLDLLADMAGENPETVFCHSWNPDFSEFKGDPNANVQIVMENGTSVVYEGTNTNAAMLNGWGDEHVRADCRDATLVLDGHEIRRHPYEAEEEGCIGNTRFEDGEEVELDEQEKWGNAWLVEQFVDWCEGGERMATHARANLDSMVLVFAAIQSAETGEAIDVEEFLAEAKESVDV